MTPIDQATEAARSAEVRERLLDAGLELFTARGFHDVTIEELCDLSGTSTDDFALVFTSKVDAMKQLSDDITTDVVAKVLAALDTAPNGLMEQLYAGLEAYMHAMLDDPRRTILVGVSALGVDPVLDRERREARIMIGDFLEQLATTYQDQGILPKGLSNLSYMALSAAIFEIAISYAMTPAADRQSFEAVTSEVVHFMKSVITTPRL